MKKNDRSDLCRLIGAFRQAAFLLTASGNLVFANDAALEAFPEPPPWLKSVALARDPATFERFASTTRITLGGVELCLVLPRAAGIAIGAGPATSPILESLPPALARVAELLMMGLSDKEIARCTELTVSSVRTYTARIYRRLGVSGRQEVLALALAERNEKKQ